MIVFETDGEIDLKTALVFGISAKKDDNAIGLFGTGLKYALAIIMREGATVTICSGGTTRSLGVEPVSARGKEFDLVTLDGESLGFTTHLGHHWEPWQAFRELYCNTLDEGGSYYKAGSVAPQKGKSFIAVELPSFDLVMDNLDKYFITKPADLVLEGVEVHKRASLELFYKTIKVSDCALSKYTYDIKKNINLTEDRTPMYNWQINDAIAKAVSRCNDTSFIRDWLTQLEPMYEHGVTFGDAAYWSDEFKSVCAEFCDSVGKANPSAMKQYRKSLGVTGERFKDAKLSEVQEAQLLKAKGIVAALDGNEDIHHTHVRVVQDIGKNILGMCRDNTLFLTTRVFDQGTKQVATTLYEEYIHLTRGYRDNNYEMQTFLFDKILSMYENAVGEAI
jgi:hypothetical protein